MMFCGIFSDHWSNATFSVVSEDVTGVIKKLQIYIDDEEVLDGIEAFIIDAETGMVEANLGSGMIDSEEAWVWTTPSKEILATISENCHTRVLRFPDDVGCPDDIEMEWDDFVSAEDSNSPTMDDAEPTMVGMLIVDDEEAIYMHGNGDPKKFARLLSSKMSGPSLVVVGGVWRIDDGEMLLRAKWYNGGCMKWTDEQTKKFSFLFDFDDLGR